MRTVKMNLFPPPQHNLKALCFSSLCDYLFICLLIYLSLPRVQMACVPCALLAEKEGCCIQVEGGEASADSP